MAKRTRSSARNEPALRRADDKSGATSGNRARAPSSAAVPRTEKKRSSTGEDSPARSKHGAKAPRQEPPRTPAFLPVVPRGARPSVPRVRTTSSVRNAEALHLAHPSAPLPPPRIPTPPPPAVPRSMELEWGGDPGGSTPPVESSFDRWVKRGDALLRDLALHGAHDHEVRAHLAERRFTWVDAGGAVSVEARAELLCTFDPQTSSVTMGWADPRTRSFSLAAIPGMPGEVDDVDEETAWHIAMHAADHAGAEYLYRVRSPAQCVFLALSALTYAPSPQVFVPATPVALVLSTLGEARAAASLGAEPVDTLRARLQAAGGALLQHAAYTHRDTDWVALLERTGRRLQALSERLPRPTFFSVAKGGNTVWLERRLADDLVESLVLLEDEWRQFG